MPEHRRPLLRLARRHGRPTVAVLVDAPLDQLLLRNSHRPDETRVPEDFLRAAHRLARDTRSRLAAEQIDEIRHHNS